MLLEKNNDPEKVITEENFRDFIAENKNKPLLIPIKILIRGGDGIIGSTVEHYLGIKENNNKTPDLGFAELKTKNLFSDASDTLLSAGIRVPSKKNPIANWRSPDKFDFHKKYGTGYIDIFATYENEHGLRLYIERNNIFVKSNNKEIIYEQDNDQIKQNLTNKLKNQYYVKADIIENYIIIRETIIYKNVSTDKFFENILEGKIHLSNRVGPDGHDHGTAFRGAKGISSKLYETAEEI